MSCTSYFNICILIVNILKQRQTSCHFSDNIFRCIFLNENVWISIKISVNYVLKGPINMVNLLMHVSPDLNELIGWQWMIKYGNSQSTFFTSLGMFINQYRICFWPLWTVHKVNRIVKNMQSNKITITWTYSMPNAIEITICFIMKHIQKTEHIHWLHNNTLHT